MKTPILRGLITALAITGSMSCIAAMPRVHTHTMKSVKDHANRPAAMVQTTTLHTESAWVRAAPPGTTMLAGYMTIRNDGKQPVRYEWAQGDVFGMVELHKTTLVDGVSTMRPAGNQTIPAGGALRIEPGGLHLMLMQPQRELKIGDQVRFRLHFTDGSALDVLAPVSAEAPAAATH